MNINVYETSGTGLKSADKVSRLIKAKLVEHGEKLDFCPSARKLREELKMNITIGPVSDHGTYHTGIVYCVSRNSACHFKYNAAVINMAGKPEIECVDGRRIQL